MDCHAPLQGWLSKDRTALGKRAVIFRFKDAFHDRPVEVPCGKCNGCRLAKSREWAARCVHEASLWEVNSFVTLTYGAAHLPVVNGVPSLRPRDFVLFMKRLRKELGKVRFLQAGEYGRLGRPHHHAILFNCDFPDKVMLAETSRSVLFRSATLEKLWPFGFSSVGEVTFESAAYVARYTLKKVGDKDSSLSGSRVPEYMTMSRRPGIGSGWIEKFSGDVFPHDEVILRGGRKMMPPRFYLDRYKVQDPEGYEKLKARRIGAVNEDERRGSRLAVKAELVARRVKDYLQRSGS